MRKPVLILALGALALAATPVSAEEPASAGPLDLTRRIVRGVDTAGQDVAGYLRIRNGSPVTDQLLSVTCACAASVQFHQIRRTPEGASMDTDAVWEVAGNGALDIEPGSNLHLMLINYEPATARNGKVRLTLTFREAGTVEADFVLTQDSRAAWTAFD